MKQILLISRCPPYPLHLGDRLIVWHLVRHLAQRGYTIDLIAFADRREDYAEIEKYRSFFRQVTLLDDPPRSYVKRLLLPGTRFPHAAHQSWSPAMWQAIEQHITQHEYDLAHLFGGVQVYEYRHALGNLPAVIIPYESYSLYLQRARRACGSVLCRLLTTAQYHVASAYEAFMFSPYDRTVVVSQRDKDELNPALHVEVIPNGVDLDYFQPQATRREPATLLFTGNYEYAPNLDAALRLAREILPQVQAHIPQAKLWLVGNAPPPEILALASEAISVTGRVPDVRPYLAQATAFVSPLRLGAGIKNKVLEALAMGCPLVATPLSVDGIAVTHGQDALVAKDTALVEPVVRLLRDQPLQAALSQHGRTLIENQYSWGRVADMYEALYSDIICQSKEL